MIITIIISSIIPTQVDFTPRYLREDDTGSWLSDGSAAATVEVHSDPGTRLMMMRFTSALWSRHKCLNFDLVHKLSILETFLYFQQAAKVQCNRQFQTIWFNIPDNPRQ